MRSELHDCASTGNLVMVKQFVEGGAYIEELDEDGKSALMLACGIPDRHDIVVYLVELGADVAHTDNEGMTALHWACAKGDVLCVKFLLEHGATITERDNEGMTAFLSAAEGGNLEVVQYLLSAEGGASISETDNCGNSAFLLATSDFFSPPVVQWLLEYRGAQITDTDNEGDSVWTADRQRHLPALLKRAYETSDDGEYVSTDGEYVPTEEAAEITAMLRVIVLHGGPPASLIIDLAPPLQRIVQDGARLRARLPAYLTQRRTLLDAHCPLLPPLQALVHGYEKPTTTDELWATGLGALNAARDPREASHLSAALRACARSACDMNCRCFLPPCLLK
jgi:hypothetical protein